MGQRVTTELAAIALGITSAGVRQAVYKGHLKRYGTKRRALFDVDDLAGYAANYQHQPKGVIMSEQDSTTDPQQPAHYFNVDDKVFMPGLPLPPVSVLEVKECDDEDNPPEGCQLGGQVFRFKDPGTGDDDWMHSLEFQRVPSETADVTE